MKLRRLDVAGFKTFASRVEVSFDRGITAIVGPNGSGKSNLVDALRWALGETNARELRGQRMDEVIYAGGGRRNRVGLAEVTVVIDNDEHRLPVDDSEVSLSRRVIRGAGDTEYRINGERARLRDLEELLDATGLTQNGYAVVAQHDIDGIIEATPGQRRVLVEQAAGVRSLRAASDEALGRIAGALRILERVDDLLADAEPRLAELERQRDSALEQREVTARLVALRGSLALEAWRAARGRRRLAERRHELASRRLEGAAEADRAFAARGAALREQRATFHAAQTEAARRLETSRLEAERAAGDARRWHDRLRLAVLQRASARRELAAAVADLEELRASRDEAALPPVNPEPLRARAAELRAAAAAAEEDRRAAEADASVAAGTVAAATAGLREADQALRELTVQLRLFEESAGADDTALAAEVEELTAAVTARAAEAAAAAVESEAAARNLAEAQREVEANWELVNAADAAASSAGVAARAALAHLAEIRGARRGTLGQGAVAAAAAAGRIDARRLAELVTVRDASDSRAVAAALEHLAGAWVVADLEAASQLLSADGPREQLLAGGLGAPADPVPAPWRSVLDAVAVAPDAAGALAVALRRMWLGPDVASARQAIAAGAAAVVLPDGRVVTASGVRGGDPGRALQLTADERAAEVAADTEAQRESAAIAAAAEARERLAAAEQRVTHLAVGTRDAAAAAAAAEGMARSARRTLSSTEQRLAAERAAVDERRLVERRTAERAAALRERRAGLESDLTAASRQHEEMAGLVEQRRTTAAAAGAAAHAAELELAAAEALAGGPGRQAEIMVGLQAADRRRAAAESRLLTAEVEALAALARRRAAERGAVACAEAVEAAATEMAAATIPLDEADRRLQALEAERSEVAVALARAGDELAAAASEVDAATAEVERLAETVREETVDEDGDWDPAAAERAEREISRLERRIAALGPVNALAPEQHALLAARVGRLHEDSDDLRAAASDVRELAAHLTAEVERRFESVFGEVSQRFGELFAELFPGGRAALRLEESSGDDGDDGERQRLPGVEILAQPPGKRLGPLRLLSGGERALTALATVLALQQVNPSPFYVFDEVDAALDDSNVLRFTRLLRRLAERQQFIVVTHNHITMAAADVLWGVTIDADGVSSVLGVRFDAEAHSEALAGTALRPVAS